MQSLRASSTSQGMIMPRGPFARFCLLCTFLLPSFPIFAQDVSLQDPSYLPGEGNLISDTGFSYGRETSRTFQPSPFIGGLFLSDKLTTDDYLVSQSFQYGLVKDLVVGLGVSCGYRAQTDSQYFFTDGYDYKTNKTGCNDPYIQLIY